MLKRADGNSECQKAFAAWSAMLPHWNIEADRVRKLALTVQAGGDMPPGAFGEAELLVVQVRAAMERADSLMTMTPGGDPALSTLLRASAELESVLSHLQKTLDLAALVVGRPVRRPVQIIAHPAVAAA